MEQRNPTGLTMFRFEARHAVRSMATIPTALDQPASEQAAQGYGWMIRKKKAMPKGNHNGTIHLANAPHQTMTKHFYSRWQEKQRPSSLDIQPQQHTRRKEQPGGDPRPKKVGWLHIHRESRIMNTQNTHFIMYERTT
jgi:hypothetical protein